MMFAVDVRTSHTLYEYIVAPVVVLYAFASLGTTHTYVPCIYVNVYCVLLLLLPCESLQLSVIEIPAVRGVPSYSSIYSQSF